MGRTEPRRRRVPGALAALLALVLAAGFSGAAVAAVLATAPTNDAVSRPRSTGAPPEQQGVPDREEDEDGDEQPTPPVNAGGQPVPSEATAPPAPVPAARFEEELSVTARAAASEGAAVTVIDRQVLDAANVRSVGEALRGLAGVQVLSYGGRGGRSTVRLRGGNANFTLVLLDGIPLNDPTDQEGGTVSLESLSTAHLERIEVVRGPQSYYFGSSALAGVVNLVSRGGGGRDGGEPGQGGDGGEGGARTEAGTELRAETGSGDLVRTGASLFGPLGRGSYFVGAGWEDEEERVAEESFQQLDLLGRLTLPVGGRSSLRLTTRVADGTARDYPDASGGPVYGSGELRETDHRQVSLGLLWAHSQSHSPRPRLRHSLSAAVDRQDVEVESPGVVLPGVGPVVPPSAEDRRFTRLRLGWLTRGELPPGSRLTGLALTFGAEVEREAADNRSVLFLPPFAGGAVSGDYRLSRTTPAAFAELAWDRGPVHAEAGLRADLPEDRSTEWSPRLALAWRPGARLLLHGSWSRAFKLPSFFALASPPALGGNPDLVPEESTGADLGLRWESPSGGVASGLTLFRNRYENLVDFDFGRFLHVNRSVVEAEGAEAFLRWAPAPSLALRTDLTWQDLDDPTSDRPLLNQPEWFAALRVDWRATEALRLWLEGRHVGQTRDVQIPVPERTRVDAYTVLDLALSWTPPWRWSRHLELEARVDNLADEDYQHYLGFPRPGRSLRVGVRLDAGDRH